MSQRGSSTTTAAATSAATVKASRAARVTGQSRRSWCERWCARDRRRVVADGHLPRQRVGNVLALCWPGVEPAVRPGGADGPGWLEGVERGSGAGLASGTPARTRHGRFRRRGPRLALGRPGLLALRRPRLLALLSPLGAADGLARLRSLRRALIVLARPGVPRLARLGSSAVGLLRSRARAEVPARLVAAASARLRHASLTRLLRPSRAQLLERIAAVARLLRAAVARLRLAAFASFRRHPLAGLRRHPLSRLRCRQRSRGSGDARPLASGTPRSSSGGRPCTGGARKPGGDTFTRAPRRREGDLRARGRRRAGGRGGRLVPRRAPFLRRAACGGVPARLGQGEGALELRQIGEPAEGSPSRGELVVAHRPPLAHPALELGQVGAGVHVAGAVLAHEQRAPRRGGRPPRPEGVATARATDREPGRADRLLLQLVGSVAALAVDFHEGGPRGAARGPAPTEGRA